MIIADLILADSPGVRADEKGARKARYTVSGTVRLDLLQRDMSKLSGVQIE